ncbi:MAG: hypothetical protein ACR2P7_07275 [bacterium]
MQLKKLQVRAFKSSVEPTDIRILADLMTVVDPNGCGKSSKTKPAREARR